MRQRAARGCNKALLVAVAIAAAGFMSGAASADPSKLASEYGAVLNQIDVAPVWSVHELGRPNLLTREGYQYIAYYDKDRYLSIAQRELGSENWTYQSFPMQMGWATGGHAKLTLAVDRDGYIHLSGYRRGLLEGPPSPPEKIYYRSENPHDISAFERRYMVSEEEAPGYPTFIVGPEDELYFMYRDGRSGSGDQIVNTYDVDAREWKRLYDTPLFDGRGEMNAYGGPQLGPDGDWHATWVWRNTPDNATNHSLSYARSADMRNWETIAGDPIELPITTETEGVIVDPAGPGDGISNMTFGLSWDSELQPIVSYHKFDEEGRSQVYNARFEDGEWNRVQATDWDFTWDYSGAGALPRVVGVGSVTARADGTLAHEPWSKSGGRELIILDEDTLEPIERTEPEPPPEWKQAMTEPELDFMVEPNEELLRDGGPMEVTLIHDQGEPEEDGVQYIARWEHAGRNRDHPVPEPWPEPTMLRVYKVETPD
ncbi:MAG: BNR repeat-containing protein [Candidatus Hydrogenedentota bacterium]